MGTALISGAIPFQKAGAIPLFLAKLFTFKTFNMYSWGIFIILTYTLAVYTVSIIG